MSSWETYARAVQALTRDLAPSELVLQAAPILLETAGAQRGAIVLCAEGELRVEVVVEAARDPQARLVGAPLGSGCGWVPSSLVRLAESKRESVLVDDPSLAAEAARDPYVISHQPGAMLCAPLLGGDALRGVLYLERAPSAGAFPEQPLALLGLLVGQLGGALEIARRREQLEAELEESRASVGMKTEFLARVSHELRTPLNSIINIPEGLLDRYLDRLTARCTSCAAEFLYDPDETWDQEAPCPKCRATGSLQKLPLTLSPQEAEDVVHCIRLVAKAGKHLLGVVNDVLDLSKLQMGKTQLELESVELDSALAEVLEIIGSVAQRQGVRLEKRLEGEGLRAEVDPIRFRQILYNLIHNAIKFSPAGATVIVTVRGNPEEILLAVQDQGVGISQVDQRLLFQSFSQVGGRETRKPGGSGLGLAITKTLVELHHGQIWVESEPGLGSTFWVRLPRKAPAAPEQAPPP